MGKMPQLAEESTGGQDRRQDRVEKGKKSDERRGVKTARVQGWESDAFSRKGISNILLRFRQEEYLALDIRDCGESTLSVGAAGGCTRSA